jgi:hypothetical protein
MKSIFARMAFCCAVGWVSAVGAELKPRVIVLTDLKRTQETDDSQSVVRLLAHADLVEVEALIVSAGVNYWEPRHAVDGYAYGFELLQAYAGSVSNLMKMSEQRGFEPVEERQPVGYWPSPAYLTQRYALGILLQGLDKTGAGKDNAASRLIAAIVDDSDPRPIYVLAWGGANVLAQTLRDVAEHPATRRSPEAIAAFVRKLRIIAIVDQDQRWSLRNQPPTPNNAGHWLRTTFPELSWLVVGTAGCDEATAAMGAFYPVHIQGHGALGDVYPDHNHAIEGDTPSLFHVLPLGFADPERPQWGTAANIHVRRKHELYGVELWAAPLASDPAAAYGEALGRRSTRALWNLFAARMDRARSGTGNRPPRVSIDGDAGSAIVIRGASVGQRVELDASHSRDGENDRLSFAWEQMILPGVYHGSLALDGAATAKLAFNIPAEAVGKEIHVLLSVTDDGAAHDLTSWRRVVINVAP